ncbi:hypothetical protein BHUM_05668 [Candidatus Burkholderia humilis]|nr:hypothetical protein BHUM_05668 [Candidatus Burkholderia humilis]
MILAGDHLHQLPPTQDQRLQALQLGISQRLDEALALRMLVQHAGESGQHSRIERVGLGQCPHRTGKITRHARIDHGHGQTRSLQRTRGFEFVATGGLQDDQGWTKLEQLLGQLLNTRGIIRCLPVRRQRAHGHLQRLTRYVDSHESRVGHVLSLPSLFIRTLYVPTTVRAARKDGPTQAPYAQRRA